MGNIPNTTTNGLVLTSVGNGSNDSQWAVASGGGSGITQLTGDVTAGPGSGSVAAIVAKINGSPLGTTTGATTGYVLTWNGTAWAPAAVSPSGSAGGDLAGTYPNPTVAKINGTALGTLTGATNGYVLTWNSSSSTWVAAASGSTLGGYAVNVSALNPTTDTGAMLTFNYNSFTGLSQWVETYVPTGTGSVFFWNGTNWESTSTTGIATGNVLVWNNSTSKWVPGNITLAGDVTGATGANTVVKIQNYPVNVTGLTGSGSFMFYSTTGSQFNFSNSPSATGSIMYWNGSTYVSTTPSGTGVLQWNSGSSTYSYVSVGGSTPNNDAWGANPQTTAVAIVSSGGTTVNQVTFNNDTYTYSRFLVTWSGSQSNATSVATNVRVIVNDGSNLAASIVVGQTTTTSRNVFAGSFVYDQATPVSSTMYLQFQWVTSGATGQINWSSLTVTGIY